MSEVALNQGGRSMGKGGLYFFVLSAAVIARLEFAYRLSSAVSVDA